jgi:hypothetical protein
MNPEEFKMMIAGKVSEIKKQREQKNAKNAKNTAKNTKINTDTGGGDADTYIFKSRHISSQQNVDNTYQEIGIIHITEAVPINFARQFGTNLVNLFGKSGFDNTLFDVARNTALERIRNSINIQNQKVCNLRMDMTTIDPSLIMLNFYGTLLQKQNIP